ncbi:hypothetical protein BDW62DRAFT_156496 [Aspergillus aurantiobrunneus]
MPRSPFEFVFALNSSFGDAVTAAATFSGSSSSRTTSLQINSSAKWPASAATRLQALQPLLHCANCSGHMYSDVPDPRDYAPWATAWCIRASGVCICMDSIRCMRIRSSNVSLTDSALRLTVDLCRGAGANELAGHVRGA